MKIIWHSNAPWAPTGYGAQTALFAPMLAEHHDVYISANYGLEAAPIIWRDIPVFPGFGGDHGNTTLPGHVSHIFDKPRDGLVITLYDTVAFDPEIFARWNVAAWAPVDHNPAPPKVKAFFRESQAIPIAMSEYGRRELEEFDPLYVPHGVDVDTFKPTPSNLRELINVPAEATLVGMVAANKGRPARKGFQQAFEAFRILLEHRPDSYLYLHTQLSHTYAGGEDLPGLLASLEIPEDRLRMGNQYWLAYKPPTPAQMAHLYSALTVLLNPSYGEGFGVPIVEAQACGTPAIVTDFSAMSEVCGAGWKVKGRPLWTAQGSFMSVPDVGELAKALIECADMSVEDREAMAIRARAHAKNYAAKSVFERHLLPALGAIEERIGSLEPVEIAA